MKLVYNIDSEIPGIQSIGGKAFNLWRLSHLGWKVPKWLVIPKEILHELIPDDVKNSDPETIRIFIDHCDLPASLLSEISLYFSKNTDFAVRSSAIDEDGELHSFAGQYTSSLHVPFEHLTEKIKETWKSAYSDRIRDYRSNAGLTENTGIAVIIQEMVDADISGVAFGINPMTGDRKTKVINALYGLGEGLVSGEFNADTYFVSGTSVTSELVAKTHKVTKDVSGTQGTKIKTVEPEKIHLPSLSNDQVIQIARVLDDCQNEFGKPQDMEFAFSQNVLYVLQARPVTNLQKTSDKKDSYTLWDNSNIIESYPGVTTPLTFSFISKSYENAYKLFSQFLGVRLKEIKRHERVFANTLGLINGRVYYNLKTWYHMLAMLPGYSINARFMEKMMGVKEKFDIPQSYRLTQTAAWWNILKMLFQMFRRFIMLPKKRTEFMLLVDKEISAYKSIHFQKKNAAELMELYLNFERTLLNEWKAPLLNDFFAMIWFGLLQKTCEKYKISENPNIHNDLLCGSSDIISTQPIHRTMHLANLIVQNESLKQLFLHHREENIWIELKKSGELSYASIKKEIDQYLSEFGERCIGELKLESVSYSEAPAKFIKILKSYVESGLTYEKAPTHIEEKIRSDAELQVNEKLKNQLFRKWWLNTIIKKTRSLVSARENLRYERTRAFGMVRKIFNAIGRKFYSEGIINDERDIFYLTKEEIFSFIEGTSVFQNIKGLIELRKSEYKQFRQMPPPSERFATYGIVYHANDFFAQMMSEVLDGDLKGIGCCPGIVKGRVQVIRNPDDVPSLNGDILVTSSTDPGWVTLFPGASGIIVERGSLLSHSAIVSREMGKPCIVSVTGLLKTLQTGDIIEMDGGTGAIKIISKAE